MSFSGNTYTLPAGANTAAAGQVVQSATWNSIHNDFATAFNKAMNQPIVSAAVNFNSANTDTSITVVYPPGFTRFRVSGLFVSHASQTLTTATAGLFTAAAGGGVAIVTGGTAVTVNTASENTNNNMQSFTINNAGTQSYNVATLFFRIGTAEGAAATADVTVALGFMP